MLLAAIVIRRPHIQQAYILYIPSHRRRPITHSITCNSKSLTYMSQCERCHKQYIGETKRRLKDRFNEHCRAVDKPRNISKPNKVSEHLVTDHHTADAMKG